jgi:hypothetical protein
VIRKRRRRKKKKSTRKKRKRRKNILPSAMTRTCDVSAWNYVLTKIFQRRMI